MLTPCQRCYNITALIQFDRADGLWHTLAKQEQTGQLMAEEKITVSIKEAARMTSLSVRTIHRAIKSKRLPVVIFGRRVLVRKSALEDMLNKGE